ncbi:pyrroline-5-carboxylate reductase dimerization domain-containing protein [Methanobacterium aggregans]|uniref:pyrroline-5-carboxylate reductase dimerization domain-containing protein n=1 Tax=Methanobacterium aggregans TaxID=1615586 RepID=UPI001AEA7C9E|nr:pyrroline-5-carboxylate reductase dimerization domain-containing protein [Methanobacterium aggregans]MBP2046435.1 pyrroline-5-carboxylate reductase [Methanobacterium aggregans]
MKKIGFIGYGSMGSMIIRGILSSNVLKPGEMVISTRTKSKLKDLKKHYPEIKIADNNIDLTQKCHKIFLFVGTADVKGVMEEIRGQIMEDVHIIYISAGLTLDDIGSVFPEKLSKVIPSITSEVGEGVSLVCHSQEVSTEDAKFVDKIFGALGDVKVVDEADLEVATNLTSCSPAFMALILRKFAEAGSKISGISKQEAEDMVMKTFYGTSKLLHEENMAVEEILSRVATPGGITEEGLKGLERDLPLVFHELFKTTVSKHEVLKKEF